MVVLMTRGTEASSEEWPSWYILKVICTRFADRLDEWYEEKALFKDDSQVFAWVVVP